MKGLSGSFKIRAKLPEVTKCMFADVFAAVEIISRLLQVNKRKRLNADKSLAHNWLQVWLSSAAFPATALAGLLSVPTDLTGS